MVFSGLRAKTHGTASGAPAAVGSPANAAPSFRLNQVPLWKYHCHSVPSVPRPKTYGTVAPTALTTGSPASDPPIVPVLQAPVAAYHSCSVFSAGRPKTDTIPFGARPTVRSAAL